MKEVKLGESRNFRYRDVSNGYVLSALSGNSANYVSTTEKAEKKQLKPQRTIENDNHV